MAHQALNGAAGPDAAFGPKPLVPRNSLFVTISQSGETADTLAAVQIL